MQSPYALESIRNVTLPITIGALAWRQSQQEGENQNGSPEVGARPAASHPELDKLLEKARTTPVTDEQLQQQRVSFAYGNAPESSRITRQSVEDASKSLRIAHA
jgi:hypothetical protein